MIEPDFSNCMNYAAASVDPVTDQCHVLEQAGVRVPDERYIRMSGQLRYLLIILGSGSPLRIIQSSDTQNGFEIWRLLCRHYTAEPVVSQHGTLGRILEPSLPEDHFHDAFLHWEADIASW